MLSKLFFNIKFGLSIWLILISVALWSITYYFNCTDCFSLISSTEWARLSIVAAFLNIGLFVNSSIFNNLFRVTNNNYYSPLLLAIFISWIPTALTWETGLEILLIAIFYLNTYNIFNGNDEKQVGYHLNAGLLSLVLTFVTPIGIGFLVVSFWQATIDSHSSWRKFLLPFYSFAVSFIILLGVSFVLDYQDDFLNKFRLWESLHFDWEKTKSQFIQLFLSCLFFLFALTEYFKALRKAPVLKRKILSILNIHFITAFGLYLLFGSEPENLTVALFALSVLFANYIQYLKKFLLRELFIWISMLSGIISSAINLL